MTPSAGFLPQAVVSRHPAPRPAATPRSGGPDAAHGATDAPLIIEALEMRRKGDMDSAHAALDALLRRMVPEAEMTRLCKAGGDMAALLMEHVDYLASRSCHGRHAQLRQLLPLALTMLRAVAEASESEPAVPVTLTAREAEILHLLATGASNDTISRQAHVSLNTVKYHLKNIYSKLGAGSRLEAIQRARRAGIAIQQ